LVAGRAAESARGTTAWSLFTARGFRPSYLKLPDAIQLASALEINAHALVTHDRGFAQVRGMRVLG